MRVAGCDPGTSSLDILVLDDGTVADQVRFTPEELRSAPYAPVAWLYSRGPFDLIAGPSGYGVPLVMADQCTDGQLALMALVRPDERGRAKGVSGFSKVVQAFRNSGLPVVFLPGVIHLPTVPAYRKLNRIDLGTPDKLCTAALAIVQNDARTEKDKPRRFGVAEIGTAFTAALVVADGAVIDGVGGTCGPVGGRSGGAWDGELAYLLSPLRKADLFAGGLADAATFDPATAAAAFVESVCRALYGLQLFNPFMPMLYVSGALLDEPDGLSRELMKKLRKTCHMVNRLKSLPGAKVKPAAQGAAILADGLAGGTYKWVANRLELRGAAGTVLDWLTHPRAGEVRAMFGLPPTPPRIV